MSIDQKENITTDNVNSSIQSKCNDLNIPIDNKFERHSPSPVSNNVTIESLSDGDSSSVVDSDSDIDEIPKSAADFFRTKTVCTTNSSHEQNQGVIVINETNSSDNSNVATKQPQIGSIAVQNSSDITFGNKTFYQGPVTIKQFLLEKNQWRQTEPGVENEGFDASNRDVSTSDGKSNQYRIFKEIACFFN